MTLEQERAKERAEKQEKLNEKLFSEVNYPEHLTDQNIEDSQWLLSLVYRGCKGFAIILLLIGFANQLAGQAVIAAIILIFGSKWFCRKFAIKAANFMH